MTGRHSTDRVGRWMFELLQALPKPFAGISFSRVRGVFT